MIGICSIVHEYKSLCQRRIHALPHPPVLPHSNMDAEHDRRLMDFHTGGDDDDDFSSVPTASVPSLRLPSLRLVERRDTWCLFLHVGLVLVHIVLLVVALGKWDNRFTIALGDGSARLQTGLTIGGSAFCTVSVPLSCMFTTSKISYEGIHESAGHVYPTCRAPAGPPSTTVSHLPS
jgi:hypothetical protein